MELEHFAEGKTNSVPVSVSQENKNQLSMYEIK